ncbi:MAG: ChaN family lipoprotein [Spirochaetota bacterium]
MKQPNRRIFLAGLIVIVGVILFLDPADIVNRFLSRRPPPVSDEVVQSAREVVTEHGDEPTTFVLDALSEHQVVCLGEFPQIAEHPRFLIEVIRSMPERGLQTVGVDFALSEDQPLIDRAISGNTYDEELVHRILLNRLSIWGYEEYAEVFRAAWEVNRDLPPEEQVQIVGLNVRQDQTPTQLPPEERPRGEELGAARFPEGLPDRHMARAVLETVEETGEPFLFYAGSRHAFTGFRDLEYEDRMDELGFPDARRAGNIIEQELGADALTLYLHGPWPAQDRRNSMTFAAGGLIHAVLEELPEDEQRVAFPVADTPIADYRITEGDYARFRDSFSFGGLTDGYVVLGPTGELSAATPISEFITDTNVEQAREGFPGRLPDNAEPTDLNGYIARVSTNLDDILEGFD